MVLSEHFTLAEFTRTSQRLPNEPTEEHVLNLRALCLDVLEPARRYIRLPMRITSGYRSALVNRAVGGSSTSQHTRGDACDLKVEGVTAEELAGALLLTSAKRIYQVIVYHPSRGGHVHVGRGHGRPQCLYAPQGGGYEVGDGERWRATAAARFVRL